MAHTEGRVRRVVKDAIHSLSTCEILLFEGLPNQRNESKLRVLQSHVSPLSETGCYIPDTPEPFVTQHNHQNLTSTHPRESPCSKEVSAFGSASAGRIPPQSVSVKRMQRDQDTERNTERERESERSQNEQNPTKLPSERHLATRQWWPRVSILGAASAPFIRR